MLLLARYHEKRVEKYIHISLALDEVMYLNKPIKVLLDREIRHLPGNSLEIIDNGSAVVKARNGEIFLLLNNMPTNLAHLPNGIIQIPGWFLFYTYKGVRLLLSS